MIRIGLLGCGRIGIVHAGSMELLRHQAQLVAVADAMPEAAQSLAAAHSAEVRTADEIIASDDIDAIVIGTPTTTHYDLIHAAAAAGKAIFCEKPVDLSSDRVKDCMSVVATAGVPFLTAFQRRFDPTFSNLQARLRDGEIGDVELIMLTSRDPAPPPIGYIKTSGGLFRDMMIHDLDMARFLLGEEPIEIFAVGACHVDPAIGEAGDVDTAAVTLKTASGKICQISNSRRATYGYDQRIEVHGARGMLSAANQLINGVEVAGAPGFTRQANQPFFLERYKDAYFLEMQHFLQAMTEGTLLTPDLHDGLRAQMLADAAAASLEANAPVAVPA
ncbi:MAG: inositol 2-dehydrogenase [Pseudomonadota bacterium]